MLFCWSFKISWGVSSFFLDPSWAKYPRHPETKLWGKQVVDVAWFKILTFLNHTNVVSQFHQIFAKWQWCFWKHSSVGCGRMNFVFISGLVTVIVWFQSLRVASCVRIILWGAWNGVTSNLSAPLMTHLFGSSLSLDLEARSKNREIFQCLNQWNQTHPWPLAQKLRNQTTEKKHTLIVFNIPNIILEFSHLGHTQPIITIYHIYHIYEYHNYIPTQVPIDHWDQLPAGVRHLNCRFNWLLCSVELLRKSLVSSKAFQTENFEELRWRHVCKESRIIYMNLY